MHSRYLRPLEHARTAPRRIINLTQKHSGNPQIEAITSDPVGSNQVITGFIYSHGGFGGGNDWVNLGINTTQITGIQTAQPDLSAPLAPAYGHDMNRQAWLNHDKQTLCRLERQSTPLAHGPGYLIHTWQGSSFAGSSSTTSLRARLASDELPGGVSRPSPPPPAAPPPEPIDHSGRFFYGPPGKPPATPPTKGPPRNPMEPIQVWRMGGSGGGNPQVVVY